MPSDELVVRKDLVIPGDELHESTSRSGGPGGQHVNKTSSRVTLRWSVRDSRALREEQRARLLAKLAARITTDGELLLHVDSARSQADNRRLARERLAELVRAALVRPKVRRKTKPSKSSKRRRLNEKRRRGDIKQARRPPPRE